MCSHQALRPLSSRAHPIPRRRSSGLADACDEGNFPPLTKSTLMPSITTARATKKIAIMTVSTSIFSKMQCKYKKVAPIVELISI